MLLVISRFRRRKVGFTLIELLIVIAIILILISIALPNFLEAQIRARVAKAKAEMKSMQTAFEMYMQDFKLYPRSCIPLMGGKSGRCEDNWGFPGLTYGGHLTTPIGYIKRVPDDLFAVNYSITGSSNVFPEGHPWVKYRSTRRLIWNFSNPKEPPAQIPPKDHQAQFPWVQQYDKANPSMYKNKQYLISSLGPDHDEDILPFYAYTAGYKANDEFYSPTNGTTSSGDMVVLGP